MAFATMGSPMGLSPFAALLGHLGLTQPSPLIPNPNMQEPPSYGQAPPVPADVRLGFKNPDPFVPADVRLGFKNPGPPVPVPLGHDIQPSQPFLPTPPSLGLFPHPDPSTAVAQIHQILGHHHNVLQALLAAIHGLANAPVGVDAHGHTQPGFHSQSTHNATVARRQGNNHPLPLQ